MGQSSNACSIVGLNVEVFDTVVGTCGALCGLVFWSSYIILNRNVIIEGPIYYS